MEEELISKILLWWRQGLRLNIFMMRLLSSFSWLMAELGILDKESNFWKLSNLTIPKNSNLQASSLREETKFWIWLPLSWKELAAWPTILSNWQISSSRVSKLSNSGKRCDLYSINSYHLEHWMNDIKPINLMGSTIEEQLSSKAFIWGIVWFR